MRPFVYYLYVSSFDETVLRLIARVVMYGRHDNDDKEKDKD